MADPRAPRYLTRDQAMAMLRRHTDVATAARMLASDELDTRPSEVEPGELEYRAVEVAGMCTVLRRLSEGATLEELEELEAEADDS